MLLFHIFKPPSPSASMASHMAQKPRSVRCLQGPAGPEPHLSPLRSQPQCPGSFYASHAGPPAALSTHWCPATGPLHGCPSTQEVRALPLDPPGVGTDVTLSGMPSLTTLLKTAAFAPSIICLFRLLCFTVLELYKGRSGFELNK